MKSLLVARRISAARRSVAARSQSRHASVARSNLTAPVAQACCPHGWHRVGAGDGVYRAVTTGSGQARGTLPLGGSSWATPLGGGPFSRRGIHMLATGGGDGGGDGGRGNGSGGNSDNKATGGDGDGEDEEEFLDLQAAEEMAAAKGVELPSDLAAVAASEGIRLSVLTQFLVLANSPNVFTSFLTKSIPAFRDRLIADNLYFYKLLVEIVIDSGCATVAEVKKRGDDFWKEFEFYMSDMVVGLVMDVVLVSLLAPVAVAGRKRSIPTGRLRQWSANLPSAMFEKSRPDKKYTVGDRLGCYVARGLEYALAGMACGLVGQGIASGLMTMKRQYLGSTEDDVEVPPVLKSALVWGLFMGASANTRYQIVFGLERVVDQTIARKIPQIAYFTTLAIRFANNIVGGEQFIDMARWAGVQ
jgi:hypothetical protein